MDVKVVNVAAVCVRGLTDDGVLNIEDGDAGRLSSVVIWFV